MTDRLHIVCLDAPSPPDYGGAIDMFYKIKALAAIGKKIHLHYFQYAGNRGVGDLDKICEKVYPYARKKGLKGIRFNLPYIVSTRINNLLIQRLNEDDAPIILEGIHCTGIIPFINNRQRKIMVRVHNNEAVYYHRLALAESNFAKRFYYKIESRLLNRYQNKLSQNAIYACLSRADEDVFKNDYHLSKVVFIPSFVAWQQVLNKSGNGGYCLYHGNLSVSENKEAVTWLIKHVFSQLNIPFIIAGKGISTSLMQACSRLPHIRLITHPSMSEINELVENAQINVLPSVNNTGVKLKLLHALFRGRYVLTNKNGVAGSGLENAVTIAESGEEWKVAINQLFKKELSQAEIANRQKLLELYNNEKNAQLISAQLQ